MNRRDFTMGLLTATSLAGVAGAAQAQASPATAQYLAMASKGGTLLEETARTAFDKTQDPAVKRFSRAEVIEQVGLADKLAANSGTVAMAPGMAPGGLLGAAVAAPFAVAGAAGGALLGAAPGPMTTNAQKAQMIAQVQSVPPGPAFDANFVQVQLAGHHEAMAIHGGYAQNGDDPALRRVARNALPLIRLHISQLTRMQRQMGAGMS